MRKLGRITISKSYKIYVSLCEGCTQPQNIHPPVPLVRAELLRAAVVVELRGRGAAHQPRLQQVLPGGVGQQQRVPLQHSRPGQWALASKCCQCTSLSHNRRPLLTPVCPQSRQQSERIRSEALRLIADRDRRTVASQRHVDQQLEDRCAVIGGDARDTQL